MAGENRQLPIRAIPRWGFGKEIAAESDLFQIEGVGGRRSVVVGVTAGVGAC